MVPADEDIPRNEVHVEVILDTGDKVTGTLYLASAALGHRGSETVYDHVNNQNLFLTVELESKNVMGSKKIENICLNKKAVVEIFLDQRQPWLVERLSQREKVLVRYDTKKEIEGEILYVDFPPAHCKIDDFLNSKNRFFHLYSGGKDHIINKDHVRQVLRLSAN